jgi:1-deoxy-D-xylulose-5-phosphate reductoisomerase
MRLPILYALTYPERIPSELRFSVMDLRHLDFCPPDMAKFPCLRLAYDSLAYEAAATGGAKTIALNAADEIAVAAFLEEQIGFEDIPHIIEETMAATPARHLESIQKVLALDTEARLLAREIVSQRRQKGSPVRAIS